MHFSEGYSYATEPVMPIPCLVVCYRMADHCSNCYINGTRYLLCILPRINGHYIAVNNSHSTTSGSHYKITVHLSNEKLPCVYGKVVFLHLADDISSKTTFDENLAICLSLRFRLSITVGLS